MTPATYALLDVDAVRHNLQVVRQYAPFAKVMAVIKANAYGHGLFRIAATLSNDVDAVAVARSDEGIRLRKAGLQKPVTVLEGFVCSEELQVFFAHRLDAVIHSPRQVDLLLQRQGRDAISVWLKLDSGMNRLGFKPGEFRQTYQRLTQCRHVRRPIGLMTHLASADELSDNKTTQQINLFNETVSDCPGPRSIANSAAILGWQNALADWVRPGIMLFGCSPFAGNDGAKFGLHPVMSLHSRIIAVKRLAPGETVGYGGRWKAERDTLLGVVAIGYGDGYPRHVSPGTPVMVNDKTVPLIGRVSMDMITVDLQDQPDTQPGDPVTLWGPGLPVEIIARAADTIPYTLLCGITRRVRIIEQ